VASATTERSTCSWCSLSSSRHVDLVILPGASAGYHEICCEVLPVCHDGARLLTIRSYRGSTCGPSAKPRLIEEM
jgi:hypothetical protein